MESTNITACEENRTLNEIQLVAFKLASEEYAVNIDYVSEIRKMINITRIPRTADYYLGVMNLRGNVLPVVDLKKRLNLPEKTTTEDSRIIILRIDDISFGITVDAVSEVTTIDKSNIEPPSNLDTSVEKKFVNGVAKDDSRLLIMLNVRELVGLVNE